MPATLPDTNSTSALDHHATMARALQRRFTLWLAVELLGLGTTIYFDWDGLLQPVIAAGLVLRVAALVALLRALPGALPLRALMTPVTHPLRLSPTIAGVLAIALSLFLVLDFIPAVFTETGWDAVLNVLVGLCLFAVPALLSLHLARNARIQGVANVTAIARHMPLLAALALMAVFPTFSAYLSPTPWLAWAGAIAFAVFAGATRTLSPSAAAFLLFWLLGGIIALHEHTESRAFVATPAILAVLAAGVVQRRALVLWTEALERMHDGALARAGRSVPDLVPTRSDTSELSEAEAMALVDRELGLAPAAPTTFREVSTDEAAAITTPFELQSSRTAPSAAPANDPDRASHWTRLAELVGMMLTAVIVASLTFVFGSLAALTPLGDAAIFQAIFHVGLAAIFGYATIRLGAMRGRVRRVFPETLPFLGLATIAAAIAALAMVGRGLFHANHAALFGILTAAAAWLALLATILSLRDMCVRLDAERIVARFRLILAMMALLGITGFGTGIHAAFAPGDMAWLSAPLNVAIIVIGCGLLLALAYAMYDAKVRFEDEAVRCRKGA